MVEESRCHHHHMAEKGKLRIGELPKCTQFISDRINIHTQVCPVSNWAPFLPYDITSLISCLCHLPASSVPLQLPPVSAWQEHMSMNNSTVGKTMFFMWTLLFSTHWNLKSWVQMCDTQHNSHLWPVGLQVHSYSINADQKVQGVMTWHDLLDPMLQS